MAYREYFDTLDLRSGVGNGLVNDPEDVKRVEEMLHALGRFRWSDGEGPIGILTEPLRDAIEAHQAANDLKIDGKIFPGGETIASLVRNASDAGRRDTAKAETDSRKKSRSLLEMPGDEGDGFGADREEVPMPDEHQAQFVSEKNNVALSGWQGEGDTEAPELEPPDSDEFHGLYRPNPKKPPEETGGAPAQGSHGSWEGYFHSREAWEKWVESMKELEERMKELRRELGQRRGMGSGGGGIPPGPRGGRGDGQPPNRF